MFKRSKIIRTVKSKPYVRAYVPEHPNANVHGYVQLHRVVIENHIGRYLSVGELVHHINGNTSDNRIENLELSTSKEHPKHHYTGANHVEFCCPECDTIFTGAKGKTHLIKPSEITFCSRRCIGKYTPKLKIMSLEKRRDIARRSIIKEFIKFPAGIA